MPIDYNAKVLPSPYHSHNGEVPLTRFIDMEDAAEVQLYKGITPEDIRDAGIFAAAGHAESPEEAAVHGDNFADIISGKTLWQAAEVLNVTLCFNNVSRVFTHQLVRSRVGVTFSQHCSGEGDWRHRDILVPRPDGSDEDFYGHMIESKMLYAKAVDSGHDVQEARHRLPPNVSTFIFMRACLATVAGIFAKRDCSMTQAWETMVIAQKMKATLLKAHPYLAKMFTSPCDSHRCWYMAGKENGGSGTRLFAPDEKHDTFPWNPDSFVHGMRTHKEVSSGAPVKARYFVGRREVSFTDWANEKIRIECKKGSKG